MPTPYEWANRFEGEAKAIMLAGESKALIDCEALGKDAMLSIPTPDHYLPLLYVLGARQRGDACLFPWRASMEGRSPC
jgi:4,5-DOPA dioxygenase extradiol